MNLKVGTMVLCHAVNKIAQKNLNMVTSVVMTSLIILTLAQNYVKKYKNGTISKIEIVRVRKRIFYFFFQFLKVKRS